MRTFTSQRAKAAAAVSVAALLGAGGGTAVLAALDSSDPAPRQVTVAATAQPAASTDSKTVGEIYSQSAKAIVEITVTSAGEATQLGGGGGTAQSQGSGFVYDAVGHVITNQHVVDGARSVTVKFSDGSTYEAEVVGSDPSTDVAVIKVDAPPAVLDALALGDSDAVAVGDGVVAIGSPFGLEQTVTTGIVSALHRQITSPNNFAIDDAIQTDAAINHGNSGGPLLDLQGRVIGVNSQIESESGGNDGVGFAVPSNTVEKIADALIDDGSVEHAYLGVSTQDVDDANGATISEVRAGTPAAAAGLKSGDVVTKIGGDEVASSDALRQMIDSHAPGDTVELTVLRNDSTQSLKATLGSRPSS